MRERSDPLVPILGSAVAAVVLGALLFVFYPRVSRWVSGDGPAVDAHPPSPDASVPVWVCRSVEGVALLIEPFSDPSSEATLNAVLRNAPHHLLRVTVCNFAGPDVFSLDLPSYAFRTPEGHPSATPVASLLREGIAPDLLAVVGGLGAVARLDVARGHQGQALLAALGNPAPRPVLVAGELRFERREVAAQKLASWRDHPDWERFREF